jgi:hypothetical protein
MKTDYEQQAKNFLNKTNTVFEVEFLKHDVYFDDKTKRDIYNITLKRGSRSYSFTFGQSIQNSGFKIKTPSREIIFDVPENKRNKLLKSPNQLKYFATQQVKFNLIPKDKIVLPLIPTSYDILACLTKSDPGTFENFCSDFGYDTDSRNAEKTYNAVKDEYLNICSLYNDSELSELMEIS